MSERTGNKLYQLSDVPDRTAFRLKRAPRPMRRSRLGPVVLVLKCFSP